MVRTELEDIKNRLGASYFKLDCQTLQTKHQCSFGKQNNKYAKYYSQYEDLASSAFAFFGGSAVANSFINNVMERI